MLTRISSTHFLSLPALTLNRAATSTLATNLPQLCSARVFLSRLDPIQSIQSAPLAQSPPACWLTISSHLTDASLLNS